jgi:cobalt-precorrin 5A hydrolase
MIVAGIGCRKGVSAQQVAAAIDAAFAAVSCTHRHIQLIAAPTAKQVEFGIQAAASARGIPLQFVSQHALETVSENTVTRSVRSLDAMHVHCVAEASALAAAGPNARLLVPRVVVGPVTCALAEGEPSQ